MSNIRIKMAKDLRDMSDMVGDLHWMAAKAVEDLIKKEGEIAKRDEELAACRVAVENCEVFRARIAELEQDLAYFPSTVRSLAETVTEREAEINQLRAELSALKAQEPVAWAGAIEYGVPLLMVEPQNWKATPIYAAPVSEAKAQGVVMPERWNVPRPMWKDVRQPYGNPLNHADIEAAEKFNLALDEVARLNAAQAAPAADAGLVDMYRHLQTVTPYRFKKIQDASITDGGDVMYFHKDRFDAALLADMAAHRAKGVL